MSRQRDSTSSLQVKLAFRRGLELSPTAFGLAVLMGLIFEFSVSFLGVGVPPPIPSLGEMIAAGRAHFGRAPWLSLLPLSIVLMGAVAFWAIAIPVGRCLATPSQAGPAESLLEEADSRRVLDKTLASFEHLLSRLGSPCHCNMALVALPRCYVCRGVHWKSFSYHVSDSLAGSRWSHFGERPWTADRERPDGSSCEADPERLPLDITVATIFVDPFIGLPIIQRGPQICSYGRGPWPVGG